MMSNEKDTRKKIVIDRKKEARSKDIAKMISEGGLGSRTYYDIEKEGEPKEEKEKKEDA